MVSASIAMPSRTSGSLSGDSIEPDTSSRNTRLRPGTSERSIFTPCSPTCTSRFASFHGHELTSDVIENGSLPVGAEYS
jgi:hypothetical protein